MDNETIGLIGVAALLALIFLRVPIGVALSTVSLVGIYFILNERAALGMIAETPYSFIADHWSLTSVPMFLLMGYFCFYAGLTTGLFRLARLWLAWLPGGLSVATIGGASMFAAVTGSSLACTAAMGRIAVPEMLDAKYDKGLATGTVAAAGTIGSMIPPSILLIIYGIFVEAPIGTLFLAALVPGILTGVMYSIMVIGRAIVTPSIAPRIDSSATLSEKLWAIQDTWPVLLLIVGVFGGLFGGYFTPTEAGAVGAALSFFIAILKGALTWEVFKESVNETLRSTASIFIIAIGAQLLTRFFALSGVTDMVADFIGGSGYSQLQVILLISVVLILLGMLLDPIGIMLLTIPILLPVLEAQDINIIWFGILMAKFLEIGFITPPVGLNVFVVKGIVGDAIPIDKIFRGIGWFVVMDIITIALLIAFPAIVLWLPTALGL